MAQLREEIISRAVACKLLSEQQVVQCKARLPAQAGVEDVVTALINAQALTRWQVKQLQAGKPGTFFVSHYKLLEPLGAGGMGQVFRAADMNVARRQVAVKILPRQTATPAAVSRFRREGAAALQLQHDHIVRCFELGQHGDTHFLVMELVDGATLKDYIARHGKLSVQETARIGHEIALALEHAWQQQIIHRDIKPANILLTRDNRVRLADLGLARFFGPQGDAQSLATQTGMLLGTLDYLAPEQAEDAKRADIRSDIYSLGCTLYHCLAGQPPFASGSEVQKIMAHRERLPPPISERNKAVENLFADIIERRMLAKRPEDRYQTPAEVAAALEPWLGNTSRAFNVLDLLEEVVQQDAVSSTPLDRTNDAQHGWDTHREYSRQGERGPLATRPVNLRSRVERAGRALGLSSLRDMAIAGAAVMAMALALVGLWRFNRSEVAVDGPSPTIEPTTPVIIQTTDDAKPDIPGARRKELPQKRELRPVEWSVLDPLEFTSRDGATITKLQDQSLLVSGTNPDNDIYTVIVNTDLPQVTGLRLEVLADDSFVRRGPGRATNGNFALTGLAVAVAPRGNRVAAQPLGIIDCGASLSQGNQQVRSLLNHRYGSAWATDATPAYAVFDFDRQVKFPAGATLIVTLRHESGWKQHTLGRFRLSATGSESPVRSSGGTITFAEATADMYRLIELLYLDRVEEYRRDCAEVFARIDQIEHSPALSNNLAWAVALGPDGMEEMEVALRLLEPAVAQKPDDGYLLSTYGCLLHRAGRYDDAVRQLTISIQKQPPSKGPTLPGLPAGTPYDWLGLAMSHQRLGHAAEARQWFDHAARYVDWVTQSGREGASDQRIPASATRDLLVWRRIAEQELGLPATGLGSAVIVGDWKFAHRQNGVAAKQGEVAGEDRVPSTLRDDSGGRSTGQNHHYEGKGACYVQYLLPPDGGRAGLDGWALDIGPRKGYLWFGYASDALRPTSDFSFWIRLQLRQARSAEKQTIASWPGAWWLWVTPNGRLNAKLRSVDDKLTRIFQGQGPGPDLASRDGQWVDIGFSFQGRADEGVAGDDTVRLYVDGVSVGTFSGDARFTTQNFLHVGMDEFGKWRCGDALLDRMLYFQGVLDDEGFRKLSGPPTVSQP